MFRTNLSSSNLQLNGALVNRLSAGTYTRYPGRVGSSPKLTASIDTYRDFANMLRSLTRLVGTAVWIFYHTFIVLVRNASDTLQHQMCPVVSTAEPRRLRVTHISTPSLTAVGAQLDRLLVMCAFIVAALLATAQRMQNLLTPRVRPSTRLLLRPVGMLSLFGLCVTTWDGRYTGVWFWLWITQLLLTSLPTWVLRHVTSTLIERRISFENK